MRTAVFMALASAWFVVASVAAFGRVGLAVSAGVLAVGCVLAAALAAGVERGSA